MSEMVDAVVAFVDTERMTMTCCATDGGAIYSDVAYSTLGWLGEGIEAVPEIGSYVELEIIDGSIRFCRNIQRRSIKGHFAQMVSGFVRGVANSVFYRRKLPGEVSVSAVNGAGALFGRGRTASIFSGDLAQFHVLGIKNVIKAIASDYDFIGSGFRAYSENKDGRVITRLCFTPNPATLAKELKKSAGKMSSNCEFQIDIDGPNLTIFARGRDTNGGLANKILATFNSEYGEVIVRCGDDISGDGMTSEFRIGDGFIRESVFGDKDEKGVVPVVYSRTVAKTLDGRVRVSENILGSVSRVIDGNLTEVVRGTRSVEADEIENTAVSMNETANSKYTLVGQNDDNLLPKPMKPMRETDG